MNARSLLPVAILLLLFTSRCPNGVDEGGSRTPPPLPHGRFVIAVRDVTRSFASLDGANRQIISVVRALGPGDSFLLIKIGPTFSPESNVEVQCSLRPVPPALLAPPGNSVEWQQEQAELDGIWQEAETNKEAIIKHLLAPVERPAGGTDLYTPLEYCAQRLGRENEVEKNVYIFSDLIYEGRGEKLDRPPTYQLRLDGARVEVLFVPYSSGREWEAKQEAWKAWLIDRCAAASFALYEPAESERVPLLASSLVPRQLPSPFDE